jgi:citrate lyase subunit alpha/citrate CoA-transferase
VNPRRPDLADRLMAQSIPVVPIDELRSTAERRAGSRKARDAESDRIVAVVEYRDGTVIDVVRAIQQAAAAKSWERRESPDRG